MDWADCEKEATEVRKRYNPDNLTPFPFRKVEEQNADLTVSIFPFDEKNLENMSGAISYDVGTGGIARYSIYINSRRPSTRQYFTLAHELGHYFLHKKALETEGLIVDDQFFDGDRALFRLDEAEYKKIETEANHFAAALIMPADLVTQAWTELGNVEECAKVFNVSVSAMSIRLERLKLI